jgi:cytochrome c peroxidase
VSISAGIRAVAAAIGLLAAGVVAEPIVLSDRCPPGFETTDDGVCRLRTLYAFYDSVQGQGFGGTMTALPPHRDGFTPQRIDLGRYLFFDPVLSVDGSLSCASCHQPARGFGDGLPTSTGIDGKPLSRAAPTLWNVAFLKRFFWDSRADSLEAQMVGPLYDAREMGNSPARLLDTLNAVPAYRDLFAQAYGRDSAKPIVLAEIYEALAAFQTSLISLNSRYDQYVHGYHEALSPPEIEGLNIFRSFVARCSECHMPPLFTTGEIAVIGAPEPPGWPLDIGAERTYNTPRLKGGFKVPTLRNIALTAPYMHSGRFTTLRDAVAFYNGGRGHAVPDGVDLELHWHISSPDLREDELDRLVDFLQTLTDDSFTPRVPQAVPSGKPLVHTAQRAPQQETGAAE